VQLGISSYTFNWWTGRVPGYPSPADPLTPEVLLDLAAKHSVTVMQIADNMPLHELSPERLDALAQAAAQRGICMECGTAGSEPAQLHAYLEIARRLGSRLVRTVIVDGREAIGRLREIAPEFERAGAVLAIENHDRMSAVALRRLIEETGSAAVGVCLDTANSLGAGEDLRTVLDQVGPYVVNLHLKDFTVRRLPHLKGFIVTGTPAGKGIVDIPALLARFAGRQEVNCILELWSEPLATVQESIERENRWAAESLRYLRTLV
jgi:3-oxoisoapionate decarboxylase